MTLSIPQIVASLRDRVLGFSLDGVTIEGEYLPGLERERRLEGLGT